MPVVLAQRKGDLSQVFCPTGSLYSFILPRGGGKRKENNISWICCSGPFDPPGCGVSAPRMEPKWL